MIRKKRLIWAVFCGMLMVLLVFCVRMPQLAKKEYIAERTLTFFYDPIMDAATGSVSRVGQTECQELVTDVVFHMRSAMNSLNREASRTKLVGRFIDTHREWNDVDVVGAAFRGIKVDFENGLPPSALIIVRSPTFELSGQVADFYADEIMQYFRVENTGLFEKMSAWFDAQKVAKAEKDIAKIEDQKRMALKKASQKSMRVVLSADLRRIAH